MGDEGVRPARSIHPSCELYSKQCPIDDYLELADSMLCITSQIDGLSVGQSPELINVTGWIQARLMDRFVA